LVANALVLCLAVCGVAQPLPPCDVESTLRAHVAHSWKVDAQEVVLDLPASVAQAAAGPRQCPRVLGGRAGWFTAVAGSGTAIRFRAGVSARAPVALRDLAVGSVVQDGDWAWQRVEVWGEPAQSVTEPGGWVVRAPIRAHEVITPQRVRPPAAVLAGEALVLSIRAGDVMLQTPVTALGRAGVGDVVQVRLPGGRGSLRATVTAPGHATINH
jgi:flagella basal body P-ring formation protein FlgA